MAGHRFRYAEIDRKRFFGVILQYLEPPLKISTLQHIMLDKVHISGKKKKVTVLMIFTPTLFFVYNISCFKITTDTQLAQIVANLNVNP